MQKLTIPFKTPLDYFKEACNENPFLIDTFYEFMQTNESWKKQDCDLHIYPYTHAFPAMLSMGCKNTCYFCPTGQYYKGKIYYGNPAIIIPKYKNENVHFMDENFFANDMKTILPLLKENNINWLAMTTYEDACRIIEEYGELYLYECGLRILEIGLENIVLMKKVKEEIKEKYGLKIIEIYYLNMTFLPNETKSSIRSNALWMMGRDLGRPIHFNNGIWYAPGQFYYPYDEIRNDGIMLESPFARTRPTYVPNTFLFESIKISDLEKVNYYSQLVFDTKFYPQKTEYNIEEFIDKDYKKAMWLTIGLRCGAIL